MTISPYNIHSELLKNREFIDLMDHQSTGKGSIVINQASKRFSLEDLNSKLTKLHTITKWLYQTTESVTTFKEQSAPLAVEICVTESILFTEQKRLENSWNLLCRGKLTPYQIEMVLNDLNMECVRLLRLMTLKDLNPNLHINKNEDDVSSDNQLTPSCESVSTSQPHTRPLPKVRKISSLNSHLASSSSKSTPQKVKRTVSFRKSHNSKRLSNKNVNQTLSQELSKGSSQELASDSPRTLNDYSPRLSSEDSPRMEWAPNTDIILQSFSETDTPTSTSSTPVMPNKKRSTSKGKDEKQVPLGDEKTSNFPKKPIDVSDFFNNIAFLTSYNILNIAKGDSKRAAQVIENLILFANTAIKSNLTVSAAVIASLQNSAISRIKGPFSLLNEESEAIFKELCELFSTTKNYKNYRFYYETTPLPTIPLVSVYKKDFSCLTESSGDEQSNLQRNMCNSFFKLQHLLKITYPLKPYRTDCVEEIIDANVLFTIKKPPKKIDVESKKGNFKESEWGKLDTDDKLYYLSRYYWKKR